MLPATHLGLMTRLDGMILGDGPAPGVAQTGPDYSAVLVGDLVDRASGALMELVAGAVYLHLDH